ncbi:PsbP-related protein [Cuspidothrix issatschenkoi]|nr:PsbP-related protein [Cuspidothrix issatschenkoi]
MQNLKMLIKIKSSRFFLAVATLTAFNFIVFIPHFQQPPAHAQSGEIIKTESKLLISASANTKFKTFVEKRTYSIAYPQNWFVKRAWKYEAYITNRRMPEIGHDGIPDYFIKTDVAIVEENFQAFSRDFIEGSRIIKRANVRIDGKNAVRLWRTDSENETLVLVTLLPYKPNKTVYMTTYYTKNNSHLLPLIERMHSSFKSLN